MEETDQGAVVGSQVADAKPNENELLLVKSKEEGEVSSSDNDENPSSPVAQSAVSAAPSPPVGTTSAHPIKNSTESTLMAKAGSGNSHFGSVDKPPRTSIQPNNQKIFDKNRLTYKSGDIGRLTPSGTDDNLVISFSDDDSGSDSEDYGKEKATKSKSNVTAVEGSRQSNAFSGIKSNKFQQPARNVNPSIPKTLSTSRTFISSASKPSAGVNSRIVGPQAVEPRFRTRKVNTLPRSLGALDRGCDQGLGLKNSKLQDLRHQIALRESELKLKVAQQNKDMVAVSRKNHHAMSLDKEAPRKYQSPTVGQLEQKEPDMKRLKVGGSYSHRLISDGQPDSQQEILASKSTLPMKEPTLETQGLGNRNKVDRIQQEITKSVESSFSKQLNQEDGGVHLLLETAPSAVRNGADVSTSCNQPGRDSRRLNPLVMVDQSIPPAKITCSSVSKSLDKTELTTQSESSRRLPPSSFLRRATEEHNVAKNVDNGKDIAGHKTVQPMFNNKRQVNNENPLNCWGNLNVSRHGNLDIQSVLDMEELLDKELEEAQERRRMCEIEERNALKAYRRAQRVLVEANARCTELFRKRELYSAHFRSFMMEDPNLLWSSRLHEPAENELNLLNPISENMGMLPTLSHLVQPNYEGFSQQGYDSTMQHDKGAPLSVSFQQANRQNFGSEPCSEPDASTSDPLPHKSKNALNGLSSPSNDLNISADEDEEMFPLDHEAIQPDIEYQQKEQIPVGNKMRASNASNKDLSVDNSPDPLLLEATLRSELFARLGKRTLSKNNDGCFMVERSVERGLDYDVGSDKTQMSNDSDPSLGAQQFHQQDNGGVDKPETNMVDAPVPIQDQDHVQESAFKICPAANSRENEISIRAHHLSTSTPFSPPLVFRSALDHLKARSSIPLSDQIGNQQYQGHSHYSEESAFVDSNRTQYCYMTIKSTQENVDDCCGRHIASYTCNPAVDPLWPLCMYELRGRCNNDKCPWQHFRDFYSGNMYQQQNDNCENADSEQYYDGATKNSKSDNILPPPLYMVLLDVIRANPRTYEPVVARRLGGCWQKCFTCSLVVSSMCHKDLSAAFSYNGDGRIEVHGSQDRRSSFFHSKNNRELQQSSLDTIQSLEKALLIFNQEANRFEGVKKALSLLSRALEANQTSEILWIVYLLIHYRTNSIGKDDMFSYAVKNNGSSYAIWLMFINSRIRFDDRLIAYDAALNVLCCCTSACDGDEIHASACILDLFLQMLDFLRMSGNTEKAIQRISGLFLASDSNEPQFSSLSDTLRCLTVSDKLIFWVCCLYFVIYKKLPNSVVHRFECEKELLEIEWPSVYLEDHEKSRALKLMEMAGDSTESYINCGFFKSEISLRSLQLFACSNVMCMAAIDGLESARNLLHKYIKKCPPCLELVLLSARIQKHDSGNSSFVGFEEALVKWPIEVPGCQCIWNQYAEHALRNERPGFAEELMDRWFHTVWKVQHPQAVILDTIDTDPTCGSLELTLGSNPEILTSDRNQNDLMFGLLNLSLMKLLKKDRSEAWLAIESALKTAPPENFRHCVIEHAMFLLTEESEKIKDGTKISYLLDLLTRYLDKAHSFPQSEPLSRLFLKKIDISRVQQLITDLLIPISFDSLLVNLVLKVWFGPSLLPQKFSKLRDLVHFVEAIMDIVPSNYQLAFSVIKLVGKGYNCTDVTPTSILFWASSILVSAIFHAVPIAPEYIWVEAASTLANIAGIDSITERFYKRALLAYPFSASLWKFYHDWSKFKGDANDVVEAARQKGIEL